MDIIINSLYSNKDIFLREFISNASNALDKIRFLSLTDKEILGEGDDAKLEIQLSLRKCSYVWESKADGAFAVSKDPWNEPLGRGTEIRLHLREEAGEYLEESKLKLVPLRNWKSIMSCLCCSNDDMQWPPDNAQFMGNNASDVCTFGNLIWITKDGSQLLSWLYLRKRAIQFMQLLGHQILAGNNNWDLQANCNMAPWIKPQS